MPSGHPPLECGGTELWSADAARKDYWGMVSLSAAVTTAVQLSPPLSRSEWPQHQYETLRLELFKAIARFSSGPKLVLIQLCRALVGFAFNTIPDFWPNAVVSMIHSLRRVMESVPVSV